ncbi:hypothetical protein KKB54_00810 [bacterium]|nr:hypothetical protein [bacterium]MBU0899348.1 hypothetical protein [bacterium]MBU1154121.1 hypothetical protein [bacterium]
MVLKKIINKFKDAKSDKGIDNGQYHYQKAFDLVKIKNFGQAILSFEAASQKFKKEKDQLMEKRSFANALIYKYLNAKDGDEQVGLIKEIVHNLKGFDEIERMSFPYDLILSGELIEELTNKRNELVASVSSQAWQTRKQEEKVEEEASEERIGEIGRSLEEEIVEEVREVRFTEIEESLKEPEKKDKIIEVTNELIKAYLSSKDQERQLRYSEKIIEILKKLPPIAQIGILGGKVEIEGVILEVEARRYENLADLNKDHGEKVKLYLDAASTFKEIEKKKLLTFKYLVTDGHTNNGEERYLYNSACAIFYEAVREAKGTFNFEGVIKKLKEASRLFSNCGDEKWRVRCEKMIENLEKGATCWICKNNFKGYRVNYYEYFVDISPYFKHFVIENKLSSSVDIEENTVVLCRLCILLLQDIVMECSNKIINKRLEEPEDKKDDLKLYLEEVIKEGKSEIEKLRNELSEIKEVVLKRLNSVKDVDAEIDAEINAEIKKLAEINLKNRSELEDMIEDKEDLSFDQGLKNLTEIDLEEISEDKGGFKKDEL